MVMVCVVDTGSEKMDTTCAIKPGNRVLLHQLICLIYILLILDPHQDISVQILGLDGWDSAQLQSQVQISEKGS